MSNEKRHYRGVIDFNAGTDRFEVEYFPLGILGPYSQEPGNGTPSVSVRWETPIDEDSFDIVKADWKRKTSLDEVRAMSAMFSFASEMAAKTNAVRKRMERSIADESMSHSALESVWAALRKISPKELVPHLVESFGDRLEETLRAHEAAAVADEIARGLSGAESKGGRL